MWDLAQIRDAATSPIATMRQVSVPPIPLSLSHTVSILTIPIHPPWTLCSLMFNYRIWQVTFSNKPNGQHLSVGLIYPRNSYLRSTSTKLTLLCRLYLRDRRLRCSKFLSPCFKSIVLGFRPLTRQVNMEQEQEVYNIGLRQEESDRVTNNSDPHKRESVRESDRNKHKRVGKTCSRTSMRITRRRTTVSVEQLY